MLYNIIMSYITYLVTWYTLCYIPCVCRYIMKDVNNIKCMLYSTSQPSTFHRLSDELKNLQQTSQNHRHWPGLVPESPGTGHC